LLWGADFFFGFPWVDGGSLRQGSPSHLLSGGGFFLRLSLGRWGVSPAGESFSFAFGEWIWLSGLIGGLSPDVYMVSPPGQLWTSQ